MCINVQLLNTGELMLSSRMLAVYQLMTPTDNSPIKEENLVVFVSSLLSIYLVLVCSLSHCSCSIFLLSGAKKRC